MQINVGAKNLGSLFMGSTTVSVPSFQRNYSWTKDQINQFLEDVYDSASTGTGHFWGPVVFLRLQNEENNLQVIDGQQRLTTAFIFISILRDAALGLADNLINPHLPAPINVASNIRSFMYIPHDYVKPRFNGSYMIDDVLQKFIIADPEVAGVLRPKLKTNGAGMSPQERQSSRELRRAYQQLQQSLNRKLEFIDDDKKKTFLYQVFTGLTDHFEIHSMELTTEDDAYVLFESLNDRGLRLNPSDILKTFTLREIKNHNNHFTLQNGLDTWDQAVENLGDYDFTKFLRHYLLTQTTSKVQTRKIFGHFKNQIELLGTDGAQKNLVQLNKASDLYAQLLGISNHSDSELRDSFARMNSYSDTHRVFLLGMLQTNLETQDLRKLSRAIERLSFRWIGCGKNAQELESIYQLQLHKLKNNPSDEGVVEVLQNLEGATPTDGEVSSIVSSESMDLVRYVLRRLEVATGGAIAAKPTIEHLAPQNPGTANGPHWYSAVASKDTPDAEGFVYSDYVNMWGNLTLLEDKLNSSIQNAPWEKKLQGDLASHFKGISASNYNLNSPIEMCSTWTLNHILDRTNWIKEQVLALTGKDWVQTGHVSLSSWSYPSSSR